MVENKAKAGKGSFKQQAWDAGAAALSACFNPRTPAACKATWTMLKQEYEAANRVANQSGFSWDLQQGVDIQPDSEAVWDEYVKKHPNAKSFHNEGFCHYKSFAAFGLSKARGSLASHHEPPFPHPLVRAMKRNLVKVKIMIPALRVHLLLLLW